MKFLILSVLILSTGTAFAQTPEEQQQLHQNVHEMRILMEQSSAQAENKARNAVIGLFTGGAPGSSGSSMGDVQSITQMRREMNQSFERTENMFPCLGANIDVEDGQAILICGDNQGSVKNDNFEFSDNDGNSVEENYSFQENHETNIYLPAEQAKEVTP